MSWLGMDEAALQARGALWTAREIAQQPAMLLKTHELLVAHQRELEAFLRPLLARPELRVILTGAGSSSFIGECLGPYLANRLPCSVEAIATTDIVSAPHIYLQRHKPTLLVSFARSGNSPESVAAAELVDRSVDEAHHLIISCNAEGALAKYADSAPDCFKMLLPEETHDKSFAMTSSFTCMTHAAIAAFSGIKGMRPRLEAIARAMEYLISTQTSRLKAVSDQGYERVVALGSHVFKGLAREAALKLLELTDGGIVAAFDSPMGFRHGPKTIVNGRTLVMIFLSNDSYSRRYDLDLLDELRRNAAAGRVFAVSGQGGDDINPAENIVIPGLESADDVDLLLPYIVVPQLLAFHEALRRGLSPDSPNRSGTVNRVVQGVRIHAAR
ncbi:MAG: SIS domain-containing protein [Steroidobacteraceae bacterium]